LRPLDPQSSALPAAPHPDNAQNNNTVAGFLQAYWLNLRKIFYLFKYREKRRYSKQIEEKRSIDNLNRNYTAFFARFCKKCIDIWAFSLYICIYPKAKIYDNADQRQRKGLHNWKKKSSST
jgi:hypothetical protein